MVIIPVEGFTKKMSFLLPSMISNSKDEVLRASKCVTNVPIGRFSYISAAESVISNRGGALSAILIIM